MHDLGIWALGCVCGAGLLFGFVVLPLANRHHHPFDIRILFEERRLERRRFTRRALRRTRRGNVDPALYFARPRILST